MILSFRAWLENEEQLIFPAGKVKSAAQRQITRLAPLQVLDMAKNLGTRTGSGARGIIVKNQGYWADNAWWTHDEIAREMGLPQMPPISDRFNLDYFPDADHYSYLKPFGITLHPLMQQVVKAAEEYNKRKK